MAKLGVGLMDPSSEAAKAATRIKSRLLRPVQEAKDVSDEYERRVGAQLREVSERIYQYISRYGWLGGWLGGWCRSR